MDEVTKLIERFRAESLDSSDEADLSEKDQIIMELEDYEDERILPFFLGCFTRYR